MRLLLIALTAAVLAEAAVLAGTTTATATAPAARTLLRGDSRRLGDAEPPGGVSPVKETEKNVEGYCDTHGQECKMLMMGGGGFVFLWILSTAICICQEKSCSRVCSRQCDFFCGCFKKLCKCCCDCFKGCCKKATSRGNK